MSGTESSAETIGHIRAEVLRGSLEEGMQSESLDGEEVFKNLKARFAV